MKIKAIRCPKCRDVIYSRARHDMRHCACGFIAVDGGFDYLKFSTEKLAKVDVIDLDLDVTKEKLYGDWNRGIDKYGIVKKEESISKECRDFMDGFL